MSYLFSETLYAGAVAYIYNQLSPDTGGSARLGDFRSSVAGAGPQIGWSFIGRDLAFDVNIRGYKEFAARNRPEGWNAYLTLSVGAAPRKKAD